MKQTEQARRGRWDAVVFDLDGTLADTLRDLAEATNAALNANGLPAHPVETYRQMVGNGLRKLVERAAGPEATEQDRKRVLADFERIYDRDCLRFTTVYDGMEPTVQALREQSIPLLVVTNKPDRQAQTIVTHLFGEETFAAVYGNREGRAVKPDPRLTLEALRAIGAEPGRSLFVGDSDVDILTARNAGMHSAGAAWGFRGEDELLRAGAEWILHKPAEILNSY